MIGTEGPIQDAYTGMLYLDVSLEASGGVELPLPEEMTGLLYPFEGSISIEGVDLPTHNLGVLGPGDRVDLTAKDGPARFILTAGRPLNEPIVQHGPFVMSTREEIDQALRDYREGRLVRKRA